MTTKYCIWYPTGGFGHFLNMILSIYGDNFQRPTDMDFSFNTNGDSHSLKLCAPKYYKNQNHYNFVFDESKNYSILIDNGINDESMEYQKFFSDASHIKVCYTDFTWPIVARTCIEKTSSETIDYNLTETHFQDHWPSSDDWCIREKYFLYLRDHTHRFHWRTNPSGLELKIDDILSYESLCKKFNDFGIITSDFSEIHKTWMVANMPYLSPIFKAQHVLDNLKLDSSLIDYTLWDQAVTNYFIWLKFNFEIPANDHENWFTDIAEIRNLLEKNDYTI